jgi:hypothetical protein
VIFIIHYSTPTGVAYVSCMFDIYIHGKRRNEQITVTITSPSMFSGLLCSDVDSSFYFSNFLSQKLLYPYMHNDIRYISASMLCELVLQSDDTLK